MRGAVEQGPIDRSEWRWALGWGAVVVALTCLPFIYAQLAAPAGHTFSGFLINYQDGNSYLAKMRQGYAGAWLFRLAFTPEEQRGLFVFTLYLALGHLARLTGLSLILVFHLARALSGLLLLLSVYRLAAEFTPDRSARRWAFAITAFGSGLAVLSLLLGRSNADAFAPVDLFVPEAIGFYSILANPHFGLTFALQAGVIILVLNPPRAAIWIQLSLIAFSGLGIAAMAPYLTPVAWVTVASGVLSSRPIQRATVMRVGALIIPSGIFLLYAFGSLNADPAIADWAKQNITPSPPLLDVLLGLGVWVPFALGGVWRSYTVTGAKPLLVALVVWLGLTLVLLYVPYALQRRFIGGVFVPLAVLAGWGVAGQLAQLSRARLPTLAGLMVFGFSSNLIVLVALFTAPSQADPKVYLTHDEAAALRWLETQVIPADVVLADPRLGLFVPGWTGARTVYGHPMETIAATVKRAEVESFYTTADTSLLIRYPITYILNGQPPADWRIVFQSGEVSVYGR